MMSKRLFLLIALLVLLLLSSAAQAYGPIGTPSQTGILAGGAYQLITSSSPVNTLASGGRYRLLPAMPLAAGDGCCCKTFLPCVRK